MQKIFLSALGSETFSRSGINLYSTYPFIPKESEVTPTWSIYSALSSCMCPPAPISSLCHKDYIMDVPQHIAYTHLNTPAPTPHQHHIYSFKKFGCHSVISKAANDNMKLLDNKYKKIVKLGYLLHFYFTKGKKGKNLIGNKMLMFV